MRELHTTLQVNDEAPNLKFDKDGEKVQGLHACFERAAELTGSSPLTLKRLFWSHFKTDGDTYDVADTHRSAVAAQTRSTTRAFTRSGPIKLRPLAPSSSSQTLHRAPQR